MTATRRQKRQLAKPIKGIVAAAQQLGCTRDHLRMVLQGKRLSTSLVQRYAALKSTPSAGHDLQT